MEEEYGRCRKRHYYLHTEKKARFTWVKKESEVAEENKVTSRIIKGVTTTEVDMIDVDTGKRTFKVEHRETEVVEILDDENSNQAVNREYIEDSVAVKGEYMEEESVAVKGEDIEEDNRRLALVPSVGSSDPTAAKVKELESMVASLNAEKVQLQMERDSWKRVSTNFTKIWGIQEESKKLEMNKMQHFEVTLEIGHRCTLRNIVDDATDHFEPTHDCEIWVKNPGLYCDKVESFMEKVVFRLPESFPIPEIEVAEPPYQVVGAAYVSFNIQVDLYVRASKCSNQNKASVSYELTLQPYKRPSETDYTPVVNRSCLAKLEISTKEEHFKWRLLRGEPRLWNLQ